MSDHSDELRQRVISCTQGATLLHLAYVGITNGLLSSLHRLGRASAAALAGESGRDPAYVERWCDAAFAYELLDEVEDGVFALTPLGDSLRPESPETLMGFAVHAVLGAHMAERAAGLMTSGERPGERVLGERETLRPWFGPMLEATFGAFFERHVLPAVSAYREADERAGLVVDLGCGNGWYVRRLAARFTRLRGIGLDAMEDNIRGARERAAAEGLADRLSFHVGDIHDFDLKEPAELIAMNRALHHVWPAHEQVFATLREHLRPGGAVVIWEPAWPADRAALRAPAVRPMAFQNLAEHVQGNRFLQPREIAAALKAAGFSPEVLLLADGKEAIVTGRVPG